MTIITVVKLEKIVNDQNGKLFKWGALEKLRYWNQVEKN